MCCDDSLFSKKIKLHKPYVISLPNSTTLTIEFAGIVQVMKDLVLENVLLVPSFNCNLLSVGRLVKDQKCSVLFTPTRCLMQGSVMKTALLIGEAKRDLFFLSTDMGKTEDSERQD